MTDSSGHGVGFRWFAGFVLGQSSPAPLLVAMKAEAKGEERGAPGRLTVLWGMEERKGDSLLAAMKAGSNGKRVSCPSGGLDAGELDFDE